MNDIISNDDPKKISNELRIQHEWFEDMTNALPVDTMRVIAKTARRFFQISNDNPKNLDQEQHLQFLIWRLDRAIAELDEPEMSDLAIWDIWHSIHRNTLWMRTFEEINKYLK